jgi:hypothetical protein
VYAAGLGASLLAGYTHKAGSVTVLYAAASSAIWGGNDGVLSPDSPLWWKNNLAASIQAGFFSSALWAEALSAFNFDGVAAPQNWLDIISFGTDFCFIIPNTRAQITAGFAAYLGKDFYAFSPAIGTSFFF